MHCHAQPSRDASRRGNAHVNAHEALPPELLDRVQDATDGGGLYLWVPSRLRATARSRRARVVAFAARGFSARQIAADVGLSESRVYQILSAQRTQPEGAQP